MFLSPELIDGINKRRFETSWDGIVDRLLHTRIEAERDHLYLGVNVESRELVLIPRGCLRAHTHILGPSDIGKSQLGLAPWLIQLIRMAGIDLNSHCPTQHSSIVVLDMKWDPVLLQTAALEARAAGLPFRVVTNLLGVPTYAFNPIQQGYTARRDSLQLAETVHTALRLEHGAGYGRDYFSEASLLALADLFHIYGRDCRSMRQLHQHVSGEKIKPVLKQAASKRGVKLNKEDKEHMRALMQTLGILSKIDIANVADNESQHPKHVIANHIDMLDVCSRPQVLYFCLSPAAGNRSSQLLGGLAFYCLYTAACQRNINNEFHSTKPEIPHITYVFVDEFQRLVTESVSTVFEQARSAGMHIIAAHQNLGQLKFGDIDLSGAVIQSTSNKLTFGARTREDIDALVFASGDNYSFTHDPYTDVEYEIGFGKTVSEADFLDEEVNRLRNDRFSRNDIIRLSADHNQCVTQISRNDGLAVYDGFPFIMECAFPITLAEFKRRSQLPWPVGGEGTFVAESDLQPELESEDHEPGNVSAHDALESLNKKQQERERRQKGTRRKKLE